MRSIASDTGEPDVLVIGSQAIIGSHPELVDVDDVARHPIAGSRDLDVMPLDGSDRWVNTLSWMTAEGMFAESNGGAYADPVAQGIATLPSGWRERLIQFETPNMVTPRGLQARAWVLEPHDLLVSKYVAGRLNDFEFCDAVINAGVIDRETLFERLTDVKHANPQKAAYVDVALGTAAKSFSHAPNLANLPLYEPAPQEIVDHLEDCTLGIEQSMRVLGRSADGERVLGRCGGDVLSVARDTFTHVPRVDETVTLSRENGHDVARPEERNFGLEL